LQTSVDTIIGGAAGDLLFGEASGDLITGGDVIRGEPGGVCSYSTSATTAT